MEITLDIGMLFSLTGWIIAIWLFTKPYHGGLFAAYTPPPVTEPEPEPIDGEAAARSAQAAEWGRQGAEKRKAMQADFQACMIEGRALIAAPGSMDEKKTALMGLIQRYPQVAESVARKLNREMGLSKKLGIPEDMLLQEVAGLVKNALATKGEQAENAAPSMAAAPGANKRDNWPVTLLH
jgi:hypothetical protein